jgi:cell wall-associated NlpC family hydrolase
VRAPMPRAALVAATLLAATLLAPAAQATDVESARDEVAELGREVEVAAEEYNAIRVELDAQKGRVEAADARVAAQAEAIEVMTDELGALAVETFKRGGIDPQLASLLGSPGDYAASTSTLTLLAERRSTSLTDLKAAQEELAQLQADAQDELDEVLAMEADLAERKEAIEARLAGAEDVLAAAEAEAARIEAARRAAAEQATRSRQAAAPADTGAAEAAAAAPAAEGGTAFVPAGTVNCGGILVDVPDAQSATVLTWACGELGKPYSWGAAGPNAYDCSGFTMSAFAQVGISLPHSSQAQSGYGTPVSRSELRPGDLVFNFSPISHVGIYIGGGRLIAAPSAGDVVKIQSLEYLPFTAGRRL